MASCLKVTCRHFKCRNHRTTISIQRPTASGQEAAAADTIATIRALQTAPAVPARGLRYSREDRRSLQESTPPHPLPEKMAHAIKRPYNANARTRLRNALSKGASARALPSIPFSYTQARSLVLARRVGGSPVARGSHKTLQIEFVTEFRGTD